MRLKSGTRLNNHYTILKPLGQGGSSQAYLAEDDTQARFAIKTLHMGHLEDWKVLEMFERQFDILKHLSHPGVPQVFEVFEATIDGASRRFLVQEYVAGQTLRARLTDGARYDEPQAMALLNSLLDVLQYLHGFSPPVLHRDIKPSNIILRESDGDPVLIDFDAARGEGIDHETADGTMVGTAGYVPMEQLAGRPTTASDIYSLGMTLVAVLTRKDPTELPVEKMRVKFAPFVNVSPALERTLAAMIDPDIDDRLQTVAAVRESLASSAPPRTPAAPSGQAKDAQTQGRFIATANHRTVSEMESRAWSQDRHLLWPVTAGASSHYGAKWSASSVCNPPNVFPTYGDRINTWASQYPDVGREWITANFPPDAPLARGLWVFETYNPGAITRVELTDEQGAAVVVWQGDAKPVSGGAMVFEVSWDTPRRVRSVRLDLDTHITSTWNEIDAIALVCDTPAHDAPVDWTTARLHTSPSDTTLRRLPIIGALVAILVILGVGGIAFFASQMGEREAPPATQSIQGTAHDALTPNQVEALDITWASELVEASSQFGDMSWSGRQALGFPNVWPSYGDKPEAWAPEDQNSGFAWVEVRFDEPTPTQQILVFETFNAGAVARIDDTSKDNPVILWEGEAPSKTTNRVSTFKLKKSRDITKLRVVLDTDRVYGWNEIDAIGLAVPKP